MLLNFIKSKSILIIILILLISHLGIYHFTKYKYYQKGTSDKDKEWMLRIATAPIKTETVRETLWMPSKPISGKVEGYKKPTEEGGTETDSLNIEKDYIIKELMQPFTANIKTDERGSNCDIKVYPSAKEIEYKCYPFPSMIVKEKESSSRDILLNTSNSNIMPIIKGFYIGIGANSPYPLLSHLNANVEAGITLQSKDVYLDIIPLDYSSYDKIIHHKINLKWYFLNFNKN